jgi:hypothetical protein
VASEVFCIEGSWGRALFESDGVRAEMISALEPGDEQGLI